MRSLATVLPITGSLAIAVGLIAVSYGHIFSFATKAGAQPWEAAILAATVDGAIVVALAVTGFAKSRGQEPPRVAKVTLVVAVVATGAANLDHGLQYGWRGVAAAVWVPLVAEMAYLLAMATHSVSAHGDHRRPATCGGRTIPVATVMVRVAAARAVGGEPAEREASAVSARPVICGPVVPVATLAGTVPVAAPDARPVICGAIVSVASLVESLPVANEDVRPVICHQVTTVEELVAPLSDESPVICGGRLVSAVEVLAPTRAAAATTTSPDTVAVSAPAPVTIGDREERVMEWLTDPATEVTADSATGADIVALLAESGHGRVSERTGRRILATVRAAMADLPVAV